jgi:hypothetical protein
LDARRFLQFVALILISDVRWVKMQHNALKGLTVREIMEAMETIVEVRYSGRYGKIVTETGPLQRDIMDAFALTTDSQLHRSGN